MKKSIIVGASMLLLVVLAVGAYAYEDGFGYGAGMRSARGEGNNYAKGAHHDQMTQIFESGTYQDLVALRQETGMPMMPWIDDQQAFDAAKERFAQSNAQGGRHAFQRSGFGRRAGCPMLDGDEE